MASFPNNRGEALADQATTGGRLTVDLAALAANYALVRKQAAPARVGAVVKADAYGLGAARVAPALLRAGCRDFFVAHLAEAIALLPHVAQAQLYVLNGLQPGAEASCAELGIIPACRGSGCSLLMSSSCSDGLNGSSGFR